MRPAEFGHHFPGSRMKRSTFVFLSFLLVVSLGMNILLGRRVRRLAEFSTRTSQQAPLQIGASVPPIVAKHLDGQDETINYAGSGRLTVLYIFTPQCGWCTKNLDNLKALLKVKSEDQRFIGLSLSQAGLADYVRVNALSIPVLTALSSETINAYRLGGTPQTLVISPKGRVLQNWRGAWTDKQKSEVEAFFNVTLPGIQMASPIH